LRIWERKVLRIIFGPICVAGYWRSKNRWRSEIIIWRIGHSNRNKKREDLDGWDMWRGW
jgi:hypothetical protein